MTPNTALIENERMVEHYRRIMYARIHFSERQLPYDRRGEIYVRSGEPDDRRQFLYIANSDPYDNFQTSNNPTVDAVREQNLQFGYQLRVNRGEVGILSSADIKKRQGFGMDAGNHESAVADCLRRFLGPDEAIGIAAKRVMGEAYAVESWVYVPHKLELFLIDQVGGGRYHYPLPTLLVDGILQVHRRY